MTTDRRSFRYLHCDKCGTETQHVSHREYGPYTCPNNHDTRSSEGQTMKRKPGRPPTPAADRLVKVETRLHPDAYQWVEDYRSAMGLTRAEVLRQAVGYMQYDRGAVCPWVCGDCGHENAFGTGMCLKCT